MMAQKFDWISVATEKFRKYRSEADRYGEENEDVIELALIYTGEAIALSELLEMAGCKPTI